MLEGFYFPGVVLTVSNNVIVSYILPIILTFLRFEPISQKSKLWDMQVWLKLIYDFPDSLSFKHTSKHNILVQA